MIGRLTGIIATSNQTPLIIDVHGVGYAVHISPREAKLLKNNAPATLYIHTHVREDMFDLYGFSNQKDLFLFELLLTVSGVGPKTALSIIDRGGDAVKQAVVTADTEFFTTIPRVGTKNAQKIIIELKNKLGGLKDIDLTGNEGSETKQILDALLEMGFQRRNVMSVIEQLHHSDPIKEKMRMALKLLGTHK